MVTQKITTRLSNAALPPIRMVSGDVGREIQLEIYATEESTTPINLETYLASITIIKPDNTFVIQDFVNDTVELPQQAGAVTGHGYYQIKIFTSGERQIYTGQGAFIVDDDILNESIIESVALVNGYVFPDDFLTDVDLDDYAKKTWVTAYVTGLLLDLSLYDLKDVSIGDDLATGDVLRWDGEKWTNAEGTPAVTKTATGNPIEFSDGADAPLVKCGTAITGYQRGSGTPSPDNIRPIVAYTEGEIVVSDGDGNVTTYTATYPSAIYRGSEDVVNGEVESEWKKVVFDGSEDENWQSQYVEATGTNFYINLSDSKQQGLSDGLISNMYPANNVQATQQDTIFISSGKNLNVTSGRTLNIYTVEAWKTYLSTHNLEIAYKLATPTTSSVTPTNLPIKSLFGYNHIESSTGEMVVDYITQQFEPLLPCHHYSTVEQVVGKWVDGTTNVYERTINLGSFNISSDGNYTVESSTDINLIIDYDGYIIENNIVYALPDPSVRIKLDEDKNLIFSGTASWYVSSGYLTIRYTKTV